MHKYLRIVRKIESFPPLLWNLGRKSGPKDGLNLGEDFFLVFTKIWEEKQAKSGWRPFFGLHQIWAEKRAKSEWRPFSFSSLLANFLVHPPFENPAYDTADEHEFMKSSRQFFSTGIYTNLCNLQRQGIDPFPLRVWVRFFTTARSASVTFASISKKS